MFFGIISVDLKRQNIPLFFFSFSFFCFFCSSLKEIEGYRTPGVSSKKLLDTGFKYKYGLDEMFDEAIQCCKEKGFL